MLRRISVAGLLTLLLTGGCATTKPMATMSTSDLYEEIGILRASDGYCLVQLKNMRTGELVLISGYCVGELE